jgi:hypothetical protein
MAAFGCTPRTEKPEKMTGCLDEKGETYILRDLTGAREMATLRGKGFANDNFARYVGHTVTVHGTIEKEGELPVFNVTKIDDAGPGCSKK